jgi:hypothetical protein
MDAPSIIDLGLPKSQVQLVPLREVLRLLLPPREKWTRPTRQRNPTGSKLVRRFAKAKAGHRMTYEEALKFYSVREEPKLRAGASRFERERLACAG